MSQLLSQGVWGTANDILIQGWTPQSTPVFSGAFPDPFQATSVISSGDQTVPIVSGDWFGSWFGPWFGPRFFFSTATSFIVFFPDPFQATSDEQNTLSEWIEDPLLIPWNPALPEPDPDSFDSSTILLVELNDLSGWIVQIVASGDPSTGLDWSTVLQWTIATPSFPDPTKATSAIES